MCALVHQRRTREKESVEKSKFLGERMSLSALRVTGYMLCLFLRHSEGAAKKPQPPKGAGGPDDTMIDVRIPERDINVYKALRQEQKFQKCACAFF